MMIARKIFTISIIVCLLYSMEGHSDIFSLEFSKWKEGKERIFYRHYIRVKQYLCDKVLFPSQWKVKNDCDVLSLTRDSLCPYLFSSWEDLMHGRGIIAEYHGFEMTAVRDKYRGTHLGVYGQLSEEATMGFSFFLTHMTEKPLKQYKDNSSVFMHIVFNF